MKKAIKLTAAAVLVALLLTGAWAFGRREGIRHAIEDSQVWILDWDEHEDYDLDINIELDDNWYVHSCYIG